MNVAVILYFDGLSNIFGGGASIILEGLEDIVIENSLCLNFQMTKNQVEYEALIVRLKLAKDLGVKSLVVKIDE